MSYESSREQKLVDVFIEMLMTRNGVARVDPEELGVWIRNNLAETGFETFAVGSSFASLKTEITEVYSFDDLYIGQVRSNGQSLGAVSINRPARMGRSEWYAYASKVCEVLNAH